MKGTGGCCTRHLSTVSSLFCVGNIGCDLFLDSFSLMLLSLQRSVLVHAGRCAAVGPCITEPLLFRHLEKDFQLDSSRLITSGRNEHRHSRPADWLPTASPR